MTLRTRCTSRPNANCASTTEAAPVGYRQHSRCGNARAFTNLGLLKNRTSLGTAGLQLGAMRPIRDEISEQVQERLDQLVPAPQWTGRVLLCSHLSHSCQPSRGDGGSMVGVADRVRRQCREVRRVRGRALRAFDGDLSRREDARRESDGLVSFRVRGHWCGVSAGCARAAGAGRLAGGGAAPGGFPPVGRGFPAAPGSASCPPTRPASGRSSPRRSHASLRGDVACFTAWSWPWARSGWRSQHLS